MTVFMINGILSDTNSLHVCPASLKSTRAAVCIRRQKYSRWTSDGGRREQLVSLRSKESMLGSSRLRPNASTLTLHNPGWTLYCHSRLYASYGNISRTTAGAHRASPNSPLRASRLPHGYTASNRNKYSEKRVDSNTHTYTTVVMRCSCLLLRSMSMEPCEGPQNLALHRSHSRTGTLRRHPVLVEAR